MKPETLPDNLTTTNNNSQKIGTITAKKMGSHQKFLPGETYLGAEPAG